ncbi:hypothetical protein AAMO2058_001407000 [Amorphochlora amoebiformis]
MVILIEKLLEAHQVDQNYLNLLYPRLDRWCKWLLKSQKGNEPGSFRWRGREVEEDRLHPNTLASGLDDYPRATHPDESEYHVDMLCWAIAVTRAMGNLAKKIGRGPDSESYKMQSHTLTKALDRLHWDENTQSYYDVGRHSKGGSFQTRFMFRCSTTDGSTTRDVGVEGSILRQQKNPCPSSHPKALFPLGDGQGGILHREIFVPGPVEHQFVKEIGYVNLFPLLLRILAPSSPHLSALMTTIRDPQHLWSPYGILSLSKSSRFHERGNAPGDAPYWRGAIWIPINYLTVSALYYYAGVEGPYKGQAKALYDELRNNLIRNMFSEYKRTGYLWEQYNSKTGKGQRSHPFTGWSALIVSIMAERY